MPETRPSSIPFSHDSGRSRCKDVMMPFCEDAPQWGKDVANEVAVLVRRRAARERFHDQILFFAYSRVAVWTDLGGPKLSPTGLIPLPTRKLDLSEQYATLAAIHNACVGGPNIDAWLATTPDQWEKMRAERKNAILSAAPRSVVNPILRPSTSVKLVAWNVPGPKPWTPPADVPDLKTTEDKWAYEQFQVLCREIAESQKWRVPAQDRVPIENILRDVKVDLEAFAAAGTGPEGSEPTLSGLPATEGAGGKPKKLARKLHDRTKDELFKAALRKHHNYLGVGEFNFEPATTRKIEELTESAVSDSTALRLFVRHFGSVKNYQVACANKTIESKLMFIFGEGYKFNASFRDTEGADEPGDDEPGDDDHGDGDE